MNFGHSLPRRPDRGRQQAERQHKLRQADAQTTALARAMCEKLLARSLNEQDDARLLDDLLEKAGAENGK